MSRHNFPSADAKCDSACLNVRMLRLPQNYYFCVGEKCVIILADEKTIIQLNVGLCFVEDIQSILLCSAPENKGKG